MGTQLFYWPYKELWVHGRFVCGGGEKSEGEKIEMVYWVVHLQFCKYHCSLRVSPLWHTICVITIDPVRRTSSCDSLENVSFSWNEVDHYDSFLNFFSLKIVFFFPYNSFQFLLTSLSVPIHLLSVSH